MKKLLLSVCLLGALTPQATHTASLSGALGSVKDTLINPTTQKAAVVAALAWYFCIWKNRKPLEINQEWSWWHVITRLGDEGYCEEVLTGNREITNKTELTLLDAESGMAKTIKDEEVTTPAYGVLGVLDSVFLSKLYNFAKFLRGMKEVRAFANDPFSYVIW